MKEFWDSWRNLKTGQDKAENATLLPGFHTPEHVGGHYGAGSILGMSLGRFSGEQRECVCVCYSGTCHKYFLLNFPGIVSGQVAGKADLPGMHPDLPMDQDYNPQKLLVKNDTMMTRVSTGCSWQAGDTHTEETCQRKDRAWGPIQTEEVTSKNGQGYREQAGKSSVPSDGGKEEQGPEEWEHETLTQFLSLVGTVTKTSATLFWYSQRGYELNCALCHVLKLQKWEPE